MAHVWIVARRLNCQQWKNLDVMTVLVLLQVFNTSQSHTSLTGL
jgi:hypothetical protein